MLILDSLNSIRDLVFHLKDNFFCSFPKKLSPEMLCIILYKLVSITLSQACFSYKSSTVNYGVFLAEGGRGWEHKSKLILTRYACLCSKAISQTSKPL